MTCTPHSTSAQSGTRGCTSSDRPAPPGSWHCQVTESAPPRRAETIGSAEAMALALQKKPQKSLKLKSMR